MLVTLHWAQMRDRPLWRLELRGRATHDFQIRTKTTAQYITVNLFG